MTLPIIAIVSFTASGLLNLLFWVAILAIVIWAVIALVKWSGMPIPQPVVIIFIALASILAIVLLFRAFGLLAT